MERDERLEHMRQQKDAAINRWETALRERDAAGRALSEAYADNQVLKDQLAALLGQDTYDDFVSRPLADLVVLHNRPRHAALPQHQMFGPGTTIQVPPGHVALMLEGEAIL